MCMESVYVVGGCNVVAIEYSRYSLSHMQKLWAVLGLYGMLGVLRWNFIAAECGRIWCGLSFMWKAVEWAVLSIPCSFSECVESFLLCRVGKMAQDVGMVCVLWRRSHLCSAGFWGFHSYMRLFSFGKLLVAVLYILLFFRNSKREERQARGRCMVCKEWKHRTALFTKNKEAFKCFQVKL